MSSLLPFCQEFEQNPSDVFSKLNLVFQFFSNIETDSYEISNLATDPELKRFLFHIFAVLVEQQFPAPSDGVIPPEILQILQHLTILAQNHPDLCDTIAEIAPFDTIPNIFFGKNIANDKIIDPQPSHFLSSVRFIAAISCSHKINITTTQSLHILFVTLFNLLEIPQLSCVSATAISGFAHNSSTALAYIKSLPSFNSLRAELAALLASDDHSIVISSLSCLTGLFPCREDTETLMKAAIHCIVSPPPYPLATTLATWSVRDLISKTPITNQAMQKIVGALFKSVGMRALSIISLLSELQLTGYDLSYFLIQEKLEVEFLNFVVKAAHDYVCAAGTHLIREMFEINESMALKNVDDLFSYSLGIVVSSKTNVFGLLKIESLLILLRLMLKEPTDFMYNLLKSNQENMFLAFQRHIERNHSFIALNFFIFFSSCLKAIPEWLTKLQYLVAESQLTALLVHVMTHAELRTIVHDSVLSMFYILNGLDMAKTPHALFDSVVSGYCFMNKQYKDEVSNLRDTLETSIRSVKRQSIKVLSSEKEFRAQAEKKDQTIAELNKKIKEEEEANGALTYQVQSSAAIVSKKVSKIFKLKQKIEDQQKENGQLHEKIETLSQKINELTGFNSDHKTQIHDLQQIAQTVKDTKTENETLKQQLQTAQAQIEEQKQMIRTLSDNLKKEEQSRRDVETMLYDTTNKLNDMTTKYHDNDKQTIEALDQIKRFELLIQKKTERLSATEEVNRQLREEILDLEKRLNESISRIKTLRKDKEQTEAKLVELEAAHREHETLYQFIHRVTEKAANQEVSETTLNSDSDTSV